MDHSQIVIVYYSFLDPLQLIKDPLKRTGLDVLPNLQDD